MWGFFSLGFFGGGLWACSVGTSGPRTGGKDALVLVGLMLILFSILPFTLWRKATPGIALVQDGLRGRGGLGKRVVPYRDMVFIGVIPSQGLVLAFDVDSSRGRRRLTMPLPRWIASHQEFLDELKRRAPNIEVGNVAELRKYSFTSYVGALWFLVVFAALA